MSFSLPDLPYATDALEPHIDQRTMEIHHGRHHALYVANLNNAVNSAPELGGKSLAELLANDCAIVPDNVRTAVRNNGGGHANHSLFWEIMGPAAGSGPVGNLAAAINATFGDLDTFKQQFQAAGMGRFGSGWAWLVGDASGGLSITSSANQDSPLMGDATPVLGCDVWEHAYYLNYQNRRADYLASWWNVVNWAAAEQRFNG
jgi:Fe-Mn family superoxide dismutase